MLHIPRGAALDSKKLNTTRCDERYSYQVSCKSVVMSKDIKGDIGRDT